jgi:subtilisin family serine protease
MSAVVSALDWVADQDVGPGNRKIVSMSAGGARSEAVDAAVRDLVRNLNVPVIVAAGNDGRDAEGTSPAREPSAITVGATDAPDDARYDVVSAFSNFGASVDVYAPGSEVRSCWKDGDWSFETVSGTSMACPLVAGAVAAYLEKFPDASAEAVADAVRETATEVRWKGKGGAKGKGAGGMLNLAGMLARAPGGGGGEGVR